jgi:hypothetical protein
MLLFPFPPSFCFFPFGIWNESNAKGPVESTLGIPDDEAGAGYSAGRSSSAVELVIDLNLNKYFKPSKRSLIVNKISPYS